MNIILNDSNNNIGGIEIMFIEMAKYLSEDNNIYFIVDKQNIYEQFLKGYVNIHFIRKSDLTNVELASAKELKKERGLVLSQLDLTKNYYVISPYFQKLQYAMAVLNTNQFKLINLWAHPQSWSNQLSLISGYKFVKKVKKTPKYYYQKNLLNILESKNAHYYGARVVPVFNNWYYSINMQPKTIETLPVAPSLESTKKFIDLDNKYKLKVLWCGRFAYFKNEAIIEIANVLNELAKKYPEYEIEYGIIGFGDEKNTKYIKENVESENIKVEFLGKIDPDYLSSKFKEYDIGISMGLTVKKMAQVGLPAIVIDSFEKTSIHQKNCNWLFDTTEGDAGDGYYYSIVNNAISNRESLRSLLTGIMEKPSLLETYSAYCLEYVNDNYNFQKQVKAILETAKNSDFFGNSYHIYRRNKILIFIYRCFKKPLIYNLFKIVKGIIKKVKK